jgi:hypothetical protein
MSWWLSTPVQRHLHQQTEKRTDDTGKDDNENAPHLDAVWKELQKTSCQPPPDKSH